jgi:hypothetical protein
MASLSTGVYARGLRAVAWVRGGRVVLDGRKLLARAEGEGDSRRRTHGEQITGRLTWAPTASGERKPRAGHVAVTGWRRCAAQRLNTPVPRPLSVAMRKFPRVASSNVPLVAM